MHRKLKFRLAEQPAAWRTHRIMELCEHLTERVLEPLFAREGVNWDRRFMQFFTFDNTCDPLEPTGTIRFRVPPLFAGRLGELETAILRELAALKIKAGPLAYECEPGSSRVQVLLVRIAENPTAREAPPEVNISQNRGCLVLRDLLGYERVNGRYEIPADELVQRVSALTEDRIAACTASPVNGSAGLKRQPSPVSIKAIRRCLGEVRQFGLWALEHKSKLVVAE